MRFVILSKNKVYETNSYSKVITGKPMNIYTYNLAGTLLYLLILKSEFQLAK